MSMVVVGNNDRATVRTGDAADAPALLALITAHAEEGHILPRRLGELSVRAPRFVVVERAGRLVACAELARLSPEVAEVRSLIVDRRARGEGLAARMVDGLARRARLAGFVRLCAFAHDAAFFVRLGFSIVPHTWVPEKIAHDCAGCTLFRSCGQQALIRALHVRPRRVPSDRTASAAARPHAY
jgi:amino-acid N-acetyltransferase